MSFFNDGRFYGFDNKHEEHHGEMEEVRQGCFNNLIDSDTHCLRFSQVHEHFKDINIHNSLM